MLWLTLTLLEQLPPASMTFAIPSSSGSQLPLALDELNALKHAVIGNPRRKADVLADDALVQRYVPGVLLAVASP